METLIHTDRLSIGPLLSTDTMFISELVNSKGWLQFIGDRKVHSPEDAAAYIEKINDNPHVTYWVARLKDTGTAAGVVTLIKREYLEHHDIGFAFLPVFAGKGYAYEAAKAVLYKIINTIIYPNPTIKLKYLSLSIGSLSRSSSIITGPL